MLPHLISRLRNFKGLTRKSSLREILNIFNQSTYDDAGLIEIGGVKLVASVDSILETLVNSAPWQAGYYSIIVSINDVAAKGARPLAYLNSISSKSQIICGEIAEGIKNAADMFDLKLLKGHTNPDTSYNAVESTVIGVAQNFIADSEAKIGDYIIAVFDLDGEFKENQWLKIFDSTRSKTKSQLLKRLNTLLKVADRKMVNSAKDVSGTGIIGTVAMLCESSKVGARIDLGKIPRPKTVPLEDWLLSYPSFGFILTTKEKDPCLTMFRKAGLVTDVIGVITKDRQVKISLKEEREVFIDLAKESVYNLSL